MKKCLLFSLIASLVCGTVFADDNSFNIEIDTTDPLYLVADNAIVSDTNMAYIDSKLRIGQEFAYGINRNLAIQANVLYQMDFANDENGFSSIDLGAAYRLNHGTDENRIISDVLFGFKFGGSSHVRTPEYADSSYYAGLRFGRQWAGLTLAGTVKSTWVFDDTRGMSFIDMIPEAYFRVQDDWRIGGGFTFRKATDHHYNQEWLNFKLVKQFGNTQYIGHIDYEFEDKDLQGGIDVKVLF